MAVACLLASLNECDWPNPAADCVPENPLALNSSLRVPDCPWLIPCVCMPEWVLENLLPANSVALGALDWLLVKLEEPLLVNCPLWPCDWLPE